MKSSTIPSLRVTPEFRHTAESVLRDGETLSGFVEESVRQHIQKRQAQQEFIARGLSARETAKDADLYASKDEVMDSLLSILDARRNSE